MYFGKRERNNQIPQNRGPVLIPILCPLACKQTSGFPALSCSWWITKARIKIYFCHTQICSGNWSVKNDIQFFDKPLCESSQTYCPQSGRRKTEMGVSGLFLRSMGHCHIITNQCSFSNSMIFQITVYALCTFIDSNMNFEKNIMNMIFDKRKFSKNFLSALWIFKVMLLFWASLIRMNMALLSEEDRWAQL